MEWRDIASKVGAVAPALGALLGGPVGLAASIGGAIAQALGTDANPRDVLAQITSPDAAIKLRQLDLEHRATMRQYYVEQLRIEAEDRNSARRAAVDGNYAWGVFVFAVLIFLAVVGIEAAVLLGIGDTVTSGVSAEMLGRILGTMDACAMAAIYYIFGSSAGSARKDRSDAS